jgi:hypothetical protein
MLASVVEADDARSQLEAHLATLKNHATQLAIDAMGLTLPLGGLPLALAWRWSDEREHASLQHHA